MHLSVSLLPLLVPLIAATAIPSVQDPSTAVALVSAYAGDNCTYPPLFNYVLDFEPSGEGQCLGNGTVAKGIYVMQLMQGCVVNAYTYANCSGVHYQLNVVGCWQFFVEGQYDMGIQGVSVTCNGSASASGGASSSDTASASPSATDMGRMVW